MGAEVLVGATVGLSLFQGVSQYNSAQAEADVYRQQGDIQAREAYQEALRIEEEGHAFAQEQKMAYIGSGVQFGGSAVVTLAQTKKWVKQDAEAMRKRGRAMRDYQYKSAQIRESQGRAALVGGFMNAATAAYDYRQSRAPGLETRSTSSTAYTTRQTNRLNSLNAMAMPRGSIY